MTRCRVVERPVWFETNDVTAPETTDGCRAPRRATYRLQLQAGFTFSDAAAVAPYLAALGVSHVYLSPLLQAAQGSTHGYDVVDPWSVSEELGGDDGYRALQAALGAAGLGQVLDVVPNHMAAKLGNRWWWDVLENGPSSIYAGYFDIDWGPPDAEPRSLLLVPVLADHYGRELEAGRLRMGREGGSFIVRYFDHELPIAPRSADQFVRRAARRLPRGNVRAQLESLADALGHLPPSWATDRASVRERHRDKEVLRERLEELCRAHPPVAAALDAETEVLNSSPDALDAVLSRQNYRLAFWRTASEEAQYRRFFDINELVAIRPEDDAVFAASHRLILRWLGEGVIDGLRVDHIDGLRDPRAYLQRLRDASSGGWLLVEKILGRDEQLPADWPVAGTTGYDWLNRAGALFVWKEGADALARGFRSFSGFEPLWEDLVHDCKLLVLSTSLAADLHRLVERLAALCEHHRRHSDHTRRELRNCLAEVIACFGVYRTYITPSSPPSERGSAVVHRAVVTAGLRRPELDGELLYFMRDLLLGAVPGEPEAELALRFQQLSGAVMAKAVEDTAFYRYTPLLSLNEVGGDPDRGGMDLSEFHESCALAQTDWPHSLLATSTHDTKRSEDARARISVLSEIPEEWLATVERWHVLNRRLRVADLPDPATEWFFYQTLIGVWPISVERAVTYLQKAIREAKLHTSWEQPDSIYEGAVLHFAASVLRSKRFVAEVRSFVEPVAQAGFSNSLSLKLLTLTAPGVPDLYQGTELWDFSLVDPDNRRPVDYVQRGRLLVESEHANLAEIWAEGDDIGLVKMAVVRRALQLRARHADVFEGSYHPLLAEGPAADHLVGFCRANRVVTVCTRWPLRLHDSGGWGATTLRLPSGQWSELLCRGRWRGKVKLAELLAGLPVALLERAG
jgi:(1->4)-alpha-D-glucan 1-alpha-D-glucosylmutase